MALRQTNSLVDAADTLCVTQSALSHQLKELETRVGNELFVRKTRPLRFTDAGKRLLQLADDCLPKVTAAEIDLDKLIHGEVGRLFMAIECHSCFNWLMPTVEQFRHHWPQVELDFSAGFTFEPLPALQSGEIDLVITSDPLPLRGVHYHPLFRYESQVALSKDHPLAQKAFIDPKDFSNQTLITYPVAKERLDIFKDFLVPAQISPAAVRNSDLTLMIVQLVASGLGVAALPNWVLAEYERQNLITTKSAGRKGIWPTLYAAIREEALGLPYMQDFLQTSKQHCVSQLTGVKWVGEQ